jgi:hypothetical protein
MKSSRSCVERRSGAPCFLYTALAHAESSGSYMERRLGAPYFLYAAMRVLKVIEAERHIDWYPPAFADALVR